MEELARQKVTDIHDLNAILRLTDFGKLGGKIWKILYELNSSPQLKARIVMPGKYINPENQTCRLTKRCVSKVQKRRVQEKGERGPIQHDQSPPFSFT